MRGLEHFDVRIAVRADGDVLDAAADGSLQIVHVVERLLRQVADRAAAGDVAVEAGQILINGLCLGQLHADGEAVHALTVDVVGDAHGDLVQIGQHVELCQRDARAALHLHTIAGGDHVEPAHAARTAGRSAVLAAGVAQRSGLVAEHLAGERALAHAGGIGLHNADDRVEPGFRDARADGRVGRDRRRAGGVRIDAIVNVTQRAELGLKEQGLVVLNGLGEVIRRVADIVLERHGVGVEPVHHLVEVDGVMVIAVDDEEILPLENVGQAGLERVAVGQLAHAQRLFHVFVRVGGGDAAAGGAELLVRQTVLFQAVKQLVVRHADDGLVADLQVLRCDGDAALSQARDLVEHVLRINDHAGAEHVHGLVAQDAGRHEIEHELALVVDDGVAGVVAALIAHDDVVLLAEQVDHAALALVAPVDAYDRCQHC